jgi:hypothetical protein
MGYPTNQPPPAIYDRSKIELFFSCRSLID